MIVNVVTIYVQSEYLDDFIKATAKNHFNSVEENGNIRFDVLQGEDDPTRFLLFEAYKTEEAVLAHKKTEHYLEWRETVKDWMAKPRMGLTYKMLYPESSE
jgi:autoinducer 2-degrading protein